ncbi:Cytoplasmic dynein 1 heavy chain 1 [Geodia barretti]|uniref:Cytoplasmic dynein 1 heavy chain 1 n=1 Tax=Geodia barretti TaxID=519541 RepID=A0AA35SEH9_GEOBA|nr:Cytoplasmic dynein 1 heavy chain 1 [Geodia barretti]
MSTFSEEDVLVSSVQKKMKVGLLHPQQNIDIPEISLTIHSTISATVKKAAEAGKKPTVEELGPLVSDSSFLNGLQEDVSRWMEEIWKVTRLKRDASSGTALQEISFWMNLEHTLSKIHSLRHSPEVQLIFDVLKARKRFPAIVSFEADTGLREAQDKVNDYSPLMKVFPVNELLAAETLEAIKLAVAAVYTHLRKIRTTSYPSQRAIYLVEAIARDLTTQLVKVLGTYKLMLVTYEEFEQVMEHCNGVFNTWGKEYDKFTHQLRERRRGYIRFLWRDDTGIQRIQKRTYTIRDFRFQHWKLERVLRSQQQKDQPAQSGEGALESAVREVKLAYENVKVVDCLDLSPEGSAAWEAALKRYDERIDRVETRIAARLRDQLGTAKTTNEMFRIFSWYNALFVRTRIRGAIREYQAQLTQRLKDDIEKLHQKFKMQYNKTMTYQMCVQRDYPPVSSAIIWARQIDCQLETYLQRVEAVLGRDWENYVEGQKLKEVCHSFRKKLNTQQLFDDWKKKVEARQLVVQGHIFNIGSQCTRTVNFPPETITLAKEVAQFQVG